MSKIDYKKKAYLLSSGIYNNFLKSYKIVYLYDNGNSNITTIQYNNALDYLFNVIPKDTYDECYRIMKSKSARGFRLRQRIFSMLEQGSCLFLTLTFTDNVLSTTSDLTRRIYVQRFLKSFNTQYVGNQDFGRRNGREHYHAILLADKIDFTSWEYGNIDVERIYYKSLSDCLAVEDLQSSNLSIQRLSRYLSKLTNHAIKNTNKRCVIIYSR